MADNLNIFLRLKRIDELLSDGTSWTIARLKSYFPELTQRTIEKDIDLIDSERRVLGASIEVDRSKRPYSIRYTDPSQTIFRRELLPSERALLSEIMSFVQQFGGLPNEEHLDDLAIKLGLSLGEHKAISLGEQCFTFRPEQFNLLFRSIVAREVVSVVYQPFGRGRETLLISPYLLKEYNRRWFLLGANTHGELLTLGLDRIRSVELPSRAESYIPCQIDWEEYFYDIVGITRTKDATTGQELPIEEILFWVGNSSLEYVRTKDIHPSMRMVRGEQEVELRQRYPSLEAGCYFTIRCIPNYELYRELSSFGNNLIVLSPQSIRDELIKRLRTTLARYEGL